MKTTSRKLKLAGVAKTTGTWKPAKSQTQRRKQAAKHKECFLKSTRTKSGRMNYGYPICNTAGRITCQGTQAAFRRASMQGDKAVKQKAQQQARKLSCSWATKRRN